MGGMATSNGSGQRDILLKELEIARSEIDARFMTRKTSVHIQMLIMVTAASAIIACDALGKIDAVLPNILCAISVIFSIFAIDMLNNDMYVIFAARYIERHLRPALYSDSTHGSFVTWESYLSNARVADKSTFIASGCGIEYVIPYGMSFSAILYYGLYFVAGGIGEVHPIRGVVICISLAASCAALFQQIIIANKYINIPNENISPM